MALHPLVAQRLGLTPWADITSPRLANAMFDVYASMGEDIASPVGQRMRDAVAQQERRDEPECCYDVPS